jgi:tetratricopeptide (TPR) repeat protein
MPNKIAELLQLQKEDPNDPFFIYALALEYEKENNLEKCFAQFEFLLNNHSDYAGTYLKYAQLLIEFGNENLAKEIIAKGIVLAKNLNKAKMKNELSQLLEDIE